MTRVFYDGPELVETDGEWAAHDTSPLVRFGKELASDEGACEMAQCTQSVNAHKQSEEDALECAICLDLFCEPLRLTCSHTFCRACLVQAVHRRCPLCRTEWVADFDPSSAVVDEAIRSMAQRIRPAEYAERLAEALAMAAMARRILFKLGNRHSLVLNPKLSKHGQNVNRHCWTMFVELVSDSMFPGRSTQDFISSVHYKLAPYYTAWPSTDRHSVCVGKNPEVRSAPFEVTRIGWGYFTVTVTITFHAHLHMQPVEVEHELEFANGGSSSFHSFQLPDVAAPACSQARSARHVASPGYAGAHLGPRRQMNATPAGGQPSSNRRFRF